MADIKPQSDIQEEVDKLFIQLLDLFKANPYSKLAITIAFTVMLD